MEPKSKGFDPEIGNRRPDGKIDSPKVDRLAQQEQFETLLNNNANNTLKPYTDTEPNLTPEEIEERRNREPYTDI